MDPEDLWVAIAQGRYRPWVLLAQFTYRVLAGPSWPPAGAGSICIVKFQVTLKLYYASKLEDNLVGLLLDD